MRGQVIIVAVALSTVAALSGCVVASVVDVCETIRRGDEIRFQYPPNESQIAIQREITVTRTPLPQKCAPLYDPGNEDVDSPWKKCMGVGAQ
jgi:hypothetical protein